MPRNISDGYFALRWEVLKRDAFTCQYCGRSAPEVKLEVDHITPVSEGGKDTKENLVTACYSCNRGRSSLSLRDKYTGFKRKIKKHNNTGEVRKIKIPRSVQIINLLETRPLKTEEIMKELSINRSNADVTLKRLKDDKRITKQVDGCWTLTTEFLLRLEQNKRILNGVFS